MCVGAVSVSLDLDGGHGFVCVPLMRDAELVLADDLVVGHFLPFRGTAEVLGFELLVAQHVGVRRHGHELFGWHGFPKLVQKGPVVDPEGGRDAFAEPGPVFCVIAICPLEVGGLTT